MLPIHSVLGALRDVLKARRLAVLEAPPGAGKTTVVPLALLEEEWLRGQRIVMLEPRRLAARNAARFMAKTRGEATGDTVGYRVRGDVKVSKSTRIEVVTEGILTRMLQDDPGLDGVGLVIFDEFHERSLHADLGLALLLDVRANLREDIGVLVMSATLEGDRVASVMGDAAVVRTEGRQFPVETRYLPQGNDDLAVAAARATRALMQSDDGSALVFLPGAAEIRRAADWLQQHVHDMQIAPLYGDLSANEQDRAIRPSADGERKIVLATNIAESSLTIEGVRLVVDSGFERAPQFDPRSGMTQLVTRRISQASADQRRGRAGRNEPGVCLRLWREDETARLLPHAPAEITGGDLAPLALELAAWGVRDPASLCWLDPPPAASYSQARDLLRALDAIDDEGRLGPAGREMLALPVHPRLAHMLLRAKQRGHEVLACLLAALLEERDPLSKPHSIDIEWRLRAILSGTGIARAPRQRLLDSARQLASRLHALDKFNDVLRDGRLDCAAAGYLVAEAYPDRVARRRAGHAPRYRMAGGRGALVDAADPLSQVEWLAVANVSGGGREARIHLAATLRAEDVARLEAEAGESEQLGFDPETRSVIARRVRCVGSLVLEEHPLPVAPARAMPVLLAALREHGLAMLPWSHESRELCARVETLRRLDPSGWPACNDATLLAEIENWLAPFLDGVTRLSTLSPDTLSSALRYHIGHDRLRELDRLAPSRFALPGGQRAPIDYTADSPTLAARVQQFFGLHETPSIADGRIPLMLHLLSPAGRPLQQTRDLASFWKNTWPDVRKEMRGRYPKHKWPEDPSGA